MLSSTFRKHCIAFVNDLEFFGGPVDFSELASMANAEPDLTTMPLSSELAPQTVIYSKEAGNVLISLVYLPEQGLSILVRLLPMLRTTSQGTSRKSLLNRERRPYKGAIRSSELCHVDPESGPDPYAR